MSTWADRPGCKPGNTDAVKMQKSIASGMTQPSSPRKVKTHLHGSSTGGVKVVGLAGR